MIIFPFFFFTIHYIIINCNINNVLLVYCTAVSLVILASFIFSSLKTSNRFAFIALRDQTIRIGSFARVNGEKPQLDFFFLQDVLEAT